MLKITALPALKDNYIWLIRNNGDRYAIIVDPGEAGPVQKALDAGNLQPVAILITHHHYDHVDGIRELVINYGIPVYGPKNEPIPELTHPVGEKDHACLEAVGADFQVLEIPGHTAGHIGYYGHGLLFCGDTLFTAGCGKVFDGTAQQLFHSLQRIMALPDETLIYCAHEYTEENLLFARMVEPENSAIIQRLKKTRRIRSTGAPTIPSTLAEEKLTNPFLRCDREGVITATKQFAGHALNNTEEVFIALRHWRDHIS